MRTTTTTADLPDVEALPGARLVPLRELQAEPFRLLWQLPEADHHRLARLWCRPGCWRVRVIGARLPDGPAALDLIVGRRWVRVEVAA